VGSLAAIGSWRLSSIAGELAGCMGTLAVILGSACCETVLEFTVRPFQSPAASAPCIANDKKNYRQAIFSKIMQTE